MGGEIVEFAGLEVKRFGNEADLNFCICVLLLAQKSEKFSEMERGGVADDGSIVGQFGNLAGIGDGVLKISGGIDQF